MTVEDDIKERWLVYHPPLSSAVRPNRECPGTNEMPSGSQGTQCNCGCAREAEEVLSQLYKRILPTPDQGFDSTKRIESPCSGLAAVYSNRKSLRSIDTINISRIG
jgi:hypothetical protein